MGPQLNVSGHVVGLIDLGTNSVRLFVVRINANKSYTILNQNKIMVRLGEGEFLKQRLTRSAMERTIMVLGRFAEMARNLGAEEIYAVATSATRDAENRDVFLDRVKKEANIDLKIISGLEEARLIYLGVAGGMNMEGKTGLFVDIGGGSTELIVGNQAEHFHLDSLKLGCVRLSSMFFLPEEVGPVSPDRYALVQQYARNASLRSVQRIRDFPVQLVVGSSGTLETLGEMTARQRSKKNKPNGEDERSERTMTFRQLDSLVKLLCSLPLEERKKVPGMAPERADIIIAGAAIIHTLMEDLNLEKISISSRSLRHGLLLDYLMRGTWGYLDPSSFSVREQSVLQLGRTCGFHEEHSRHMGALCLDLFDSAKNAGLHAMGEDARELLYYGALLHDIGLFLSFSNHHAHSHYLISHAELLGFHDKEIAIMAALAYFHRKRPPKKKDPAFTALDTEARRMVFPLSMLLRMGESLDRGHRQAVKKATFVREKKTLLLQLETKEDPQLEIWALEEHQEYFLKTFGERFGIQVTSLTS